MKRNLLLFGLSISFFCGYTQTYGDYDVIINVAGNGFAHQSIIYFDDESWDPLQAPTYGWDACCDALLVLGNANQPQIFTQVVAPPASPNNHRLTINGLPHLYEPIDVPLGFLPGTLAQYTFTFTELYTLPLGVTLELEDLAQNVTQDLLMDSSYVTWGAVSDNEARFILHFNPSNVTSIEQQLEFGSEIRVRNQSGGIVISGLTNYSNSSFRMLDMLGNVVCTKQISNTDQELSIDGSSVRKGVYLLEFISPKNERKAIKICF